MDIVGARFADLESSNAALAEIQARVAVEAVVRIVEQHGGTLLSRCVEWPHPSLTGGDSAALGPGLSRDQGGRPIKCHGAQTSRSGPAPASPPQRGAQMERGAQKRWRRPAVLMRVRAARVRRFSV